MTDKQILDALNTRAIKYGMKWCIQIDGCSISIRLEEIQNGEYDDLRTGLLDSFMKETQRKRNAEKKAKSLPSFPGNDPQSRDGPLSFDN